MDPTSRATRLYYTLPASAQNAVLTGAGWKARRTRFGPEFRRRLDMMEESHRWPRDRIRDHQDAMVADLVARAYEETGYYRRVLDERGLTPSDVRGISDLPKLPVLTKDDIRANFDELKSNRVDRRRFIEVQTSGSTGAPLRLLTTREAISFKWAVWWRHRGWFGKGRGDLHANVMTKPLVPPDAVRPPYWRWNRLENQAILPMQQIVPSKTPEIAAFLDRTRFEFWSGYPSILHSLAVQAADLGISLVDGPDVIFTGAEAVLDQQRSDLLRFAGAPVAEMYGFNEGAGNASSCEEANLHEDFEFGHLECMDPVLDPDTGTIRGRILATGFSTGAFPLIRYDVGDVGRWTGEDYSCPCGRESRVFEVIEGRWEDYIVTPAGHQARRLGEIFKQMPNLKQFQMVQDDPSSVTLRIVRRDGYTQDDEDRLRSRVAVWISDSLTVDFEYVDGIEPGPNGKYRRIVSNLRPGGEG